MPSRTTSASVSVTGLEPRRRTAGRTARGASIAVDCGNGVGALATPQVLERLGADIVAINASVDGHFRAARANPRRRRSEFTAFLDDGSFDLGLAHDGDADRLVVLGPDGSVIHEDTVLAVVAARYTADSDADDPVVVTTPNASARIDERVRAAGGRVERVRLGSLHEESRANALEEARTPSSSSPPNPGNTSTPPSAAGSTAWSVPRSSRRSSPTPAIPIDSGTPLPNAPTERSASSARTRPKPT